MKKWIIGTAALIIGCSFSLVSTPQPVEGATKEITYKSCKELNNVYKNGVSKATGMKNTVVSRKTKKTEYKTSKAYVSANLYNLNVTLDKDEDGIACEK